MTPSGILTLLTDFGTSDHYVAAMKGVVLSRAPGLTLVDISHHVPAQDVARASWLLAEGAPWFPPGTVHVVVVDPGVGSARRPLVARVGDQVVVGPDNGFLTLLARGRALQAWELAAPELGLDSRSATFHGRDLFAPAGALLASGAVRPEDCGPAIEPELLDLPAPRIGEHSARAVVVTVDHFGNLITDLPGSLLPDQPLRITIEGRRVDGFVRTYSDAAPGQIVALIGSGGWLEVAAAQGDAAQDLGIGVGAGVLVSWA